MQKYHYIFSEGSRVNQITCAILINLTVFSYGASIGWMSPMGLLLQSEDSPRGEPISDNELSWMASVAYLSAIPMNYIMAFMGDRIGRKKTLIFMSMTFATLWAIKLCSTDCWALITARALVGVSMAGCYVTAPVYIKEISEDCIRGLLGSLAILFHTIGNLFGYIIGDLLRYNTVLWVCLALPVLHIVLFLAMPESPSYLIKIGKHEEAAKVMAWLRCRNATDTLVQGELDRIKKEQTNDENSNDIKIKALFEDKILFRAFRIAMMVSLVREMCGVTLIINFAGEIFAMSSEKVFSALTPNQQAMLLGVVQTAGSVLASSLVERSGRKPLLLITSMVSMVSMCCLGSWFLAKNFGIVSMTWMPIASTCLCIFSDAAGLLPISIVVTCDLFSYKYRGTVLAITMATACFADFLLMLLFKPIVNYLGIYTVFYFFCFVCLMNAVYVLLVIPETKQKSLEEIYEKLKTKKERQKDALSGVRTEVEVKT